MLNDLRRELALWEDAATGEYLSGELSAANLTLYPFVALFPRLAGRRAPGRRTGNEPLRPPGARAANR
ncbi:MAG: hypothetical protein ACREDI_00805 [Roseiarcus sp.]